MTLHARRTGLKPMLTRRLLLLSATAAPAASALLPLPAWAQSPDQAVAFIEQTAKELVAVVNGPGSIADKRVKLQAIVDRTVDVNEVARFCLGRFWSTASPQQQKDYLDLFHRVLMINITGKVGDYQGVSFTVGHAQPREGAILVSTTVERPGNPPSKVDWLVSTQSGGLKIIDVIAEGTSLRLTQRSDYSSYLAHNSNSVQALINALKQQASQQG
jgi:phospholipid transport system substrate-binding protein